MVILHYAIISLFAKTNDLNSSLHKNLVLELCVCTNFLTILGLQNTCRSEEMYDQPSERILFSE